jgi:hypothetical protein
VIVRRILVLVVLALVVWQGARLVPRLFRRPSAHTVVVSNDGKRTIDTLEVRVGRQRFDGGSLEAGDSVAFEFRVARDVPIALTWTWDDRPDEDHGWNGGRVPVGPLVERFHIAVRDDGGVVFRVTAASETKPEPEPAKKPGKKKAQSS